MTHILTSTEILEREDLYDIQEMDSIYYQLTDGEMGWLDFVRGRYAIADYLDSVLDDNNVATIDQYALSAAMNGDNECCPFAPCLDRETGLAKLIFWIYSEEPEYSDYFDET